MAVYFDHKAQAPYPGQNTDIHWHPTLPILAVASYADSTGGSVNLYKDEGQHLADAEIRKSRSASALSWQGKRKALAVGWETGAVTIYNRAEREAFESPTTQRGHAVEITALAWSSAGTRLVSGDVSGMLIVWEIDARCQFLSSIKVSNLDQQLTDIVLQLQISLDQTSDIQRLAKAAVSGDQHALDMFNYVQNNSGKTQNTEAITFFLGTKQGKVYHIGVSGEAVLRFTVESGVRKLLYYNDKDVLITITDTMIVTQHSISKDNQTNEISKVKLSGRNAHPDTIWAADGILATCTGENVIRMWDLEREENFVLNLETQNTFTQSENITCISYCKAKGILAGGTDNGKVAMWKYSQNLNESKTSLRANEDPELRWTLQPACNVAGPVSEIAWGSDENLLAVNIVSDIYILCEHIMSAHCSEQTAVIQTAPSELSVDIFSANIHHKLKADINVKGIYCTKECIAIWDYKKLVIYSIPSDNKVIKVAGAFDCTSKSVCVYEQNCYTLDANNVLVHTLQGTVKQLLPFSEADGQPQNLSINLHHLVVSGDNGVLKCFDLSRREAKQHGNTKNIRKHFPQFQSIENVKCNSQGSKVAFIIKLTDNSIDTKLHFWDIDAETLTYFDLMFGISDSGDIQPDTSDDLKRSPVTIFWDNSDPRLIVVDTSSLSDQQHSRYKGQRSMDSKTRQRWAADSIQNQANDLKEPQRLIVSLFVTSEHGIHMQDRFIPNREQGTLLDVLVPHYYFTKENHRSQNTNQITSEAGTDFNDFMTNVDGTTKHCPMVTRRTMADFYGLEKAEKAVKEAIMNFSFCLTIGNMDEAFKAIKLIKSEKVWQSMARMSVKTQRLDVAKVCLGYVRNARAAKALRDINTILDKDDKSSLDAKVSILATQLGLDEDAERLLIESKKYDMLNKYYQYCGKWLKAIEVAEKFDRIHLRTTHFNYARHLETIGNIDEAIVHYELSDTHRIQVPRMLAEDIPKLEVYIVKSKDKALKKWWAQYLESTGQMEVALKFYKQAEDILSLVRVSCYCGNMDKAAEICNETGDKAACYHLARQLENNDETKEAIHFFTKAEAYASAIRICKDNNMEEQLMNLAFIARPEDMLEAARFYEERPNYQDRAVTLYHKAGQLSKALDIAYSTKQYAALQMISEDLNDNTDPELLKQCASFFVDHGQFDRAVDLLAVAKKYREAVQICIDSHVDMSEDLVEKLTPSAPDKNDVSANKERVKILEAIAEVCMAQGKYHLATKKYTQAANKIKAMKSLLKSGDTEKVIFFAGVSRNRDVYIMAANYLQSLDWRANPAIMKNIISFYTKGRALDSLSSFYDACAQVEMDEFQNYEKALGALGESAKCLAKSQTQNEQLKEERMNDLKQRMHILKKFIQLKRGEEEDLVKGVQILLRQPDINRSVRVGDLFNLLVQYYANKQQWRQAYETLEELHMRMPHTNLSYYVPTQSIQTIHSALNITLIESPILQSLQVKGRQSDGSPNKAGPGAGPGLNSDEEQIQEEDGVNDDFYN